MYGRFIIIPGIEVHSKTMERKIDLELYDTRQNGVCVEVERHTYISIKGRHVLCI